MRACWCGNSELQPFGPEYGQCSTCGTLVLTKELPPEHLVVSDDETAFYGKNYWLEHQEKDFGYVDLHTRARYDLTERNLHWLRALLKYRLPPADVIELGCSHASYVALMQQAGYRAVGVEMSPWIVQFGRQTFDVPVSVGPVEALALQPGSFDVIALMDVLEHLPDPEATMRHCMDLLRPDGLLLIQTPQFKESTCYEALVESKMPFLEQLKSDEHLYLFSEQSVTELFRRLGAAHINFEPAIFSQYDMFFAVSRAPFNENSKQDMESALLGTPHRRFVQALLDMDSTIQAQRKHIDELVQWQRDCASQVQTLTGWVHEARAQAEELRAKKK